MSASQARVKNQGEILDKHREIARASLPSHQPEYLTYQVEYENLPDSVHLAAHRIQEKGSALWVMSHATDFKPRICDLSTSGWWAWDTSSLKIAL